MAHIGILTSGDDCPGVNAVIRTCALCDIRRNRRRSKTYSRTRRMSPAGCVLFAGRPRQARRVMVPWQSRGMSQGAVSRDTLGSIRRASEHRFLTNEGRSSAWTGR
ncbi:hypothetical protein E3T27_15915 [Cryobacterium lyxosi]|uniref:Phosphofructokinase domain-containing protein n=1 Tax=Cryobacterium lyxosi TaxID=1259228 RepID=A0A4R8Z8E0_9MICO|nr:hypothetical protein E3T27_15915 [Cryobacterium lyxosi]